MTGNAQRPTPNAQRRLEDEENARSSLPDIRFRTQKGNVSFGVSLSRPDAGHENPDEFFDVIETHGEVCGCATFASGPTSRNQRFISRSSLRQIRSL
jgi:hypothetical protein